MSTVLERMREMQDVATKVGAPISMSAENYKEVADKLEKQLAALKVAHQTVLEVAHAQEVGANWWTHGENAMYQHIRMHVRRAFDAFKTVGEF